MKKLFSTILVLGFLFSVNAYAEDFYLSCEGKVKSISTMYNSTDDLFEEWKIVTADKKIFIVDLINSGHWNYRGMYLDNELSFANNVLNIDVYNKKGGSGYVIKKYTHSISLNSGRFSWSQFLESPSESWIFQGQGRCEGYKEILNYLNK